MWMQLGEVIIHNSSHALKSNQTAFHSSHISNQYIDANLLQHDNYFEKGMQFPPHAAVTDPAKNFQRNW